jgi:1-deoxyxylulose-5-phosphate synthase
VRHHPAAWTACGAERSVRAGSDPVLAAHYDDADFDVVDAVRAVAAERGLPPAQIALAWLLVRPAVSATVVGATKPGHVDDASAALGVALSDEETARLQAPYRPHPVIGHS